MERPQVDTACLGAFAFDVNGESGRTVEDAKQYDAEYYVNKVLRAAESVVSPLRWRENDIWEYLADRENAGLSWF